ncbi:MAG: zinc-binding metallopeptidase family protein, partial [Lutibacter sp.]
MKHSFIAIFLLIAFSSYDSLKSVINSEPTVNKADSIVVRQLFNSALSNGKSYQWLDHLSNNIGGRLSGSPQAQQAVEWGEKLMKDLGFDKVWLQPVMVPHWVRGEKEVAYFTIGKIKYDVAICALGGSVSTPKKGVSGEVIEVNSLAEAEALGEKLRGKIVFFNRPFEDTPIETFKSYSGCVDQRGGGAKVTGKFGVLGVIVRSMTHSIDNFPHTGAMGYGDIQDNEKVPAAAISTIAANLLSEKLKENPNLKFYFKQSCETLP